MRARRGLLWAAGATAGAVAGAMAARTAIHRGRRRADPELEARLGERPPERIEPVVALDGTVLDVRAAGPPDAPVIVFAHGFSVDMTTWHYQWTELSPRYRCVLFDHRGHGRSAAAAGRDYSLRAMGDDVAAVLDASVTNGPAVLVGHSMGGMAVLALAEAHPEEFGTRVAGVVLADTAAAELLRGALGGVASRIQAVAGDAGHAERVRDFFRSGRSDLAYLVARLTNFGRDADPSLVEYVAGISGHAPLEVWSDALAGVLSLDVRHALSNIVVPALVIVGDVDRLTPPTSAKAMAEELPEAELIVLEGAGHLSMLERPGRFNRVLTAFVDRVLGADPVSPGQPRIGTAT